MRSGVGFSRGSFRGSRGPYLHNRTHFRIRSYGFRNNCYGYGCRGYGYPWWYGGYYDPWWWNDNSSYDQDYYSNLAAANEMNQESLEEQRMRRQEKADGDQDAYMPRGSNGTAAANANTPDPIIPPTVLVFRDGHKQEIQNYAIVGQTLWDFAPQHTGKIPLTALDLVATAKANDDRGVTFRLPASGEAQ